MRTGSEATTQEERAEFYALKSNQISLEKTEAFAEMMRFETAVVVRLLVPNLDNLEEVNENKKWQWYYCAVSGAFSTSFDVLHIWNGSEFEQIRLYV